MHILLIEPDVILARIYQSAFVRVGHTVDVAASAQVAVHLADNQRPDLVVLELQLPWHNGIEFLYEFRSYPEWQTIPVVIHSFVALQELEAMPTLKKELNVARMLYKPKTDLKQLMTAVATMTSAAQLQP